MRILKNVFLKLIILFSLAVSLLSAFAKIMNYEPRGIGGGGAMAGLSLSPYSHLWFVGTDMGTLFRSENEGQSWEAVNQRQAAFDSNLNQSSSVGFSADPLVVFYAEGGKKPKRSIDAGVHWQSIPIALENNEYIRYWLGSSIDPNFIFCATTHGLFKSIDQGLSWNRVPEVVGKSVGTFFFYSKSGTQIFHANNKSIFISRDQGHHFEPWYTPVGTEIRSFAGGAAEQSMTLAWIDSNGSACSWVHTAEFSTEEAKFQTQSDCGYIWLATIPNSNEPVQFVRTEKEGGRYLQMAENDPNTIYVTGGDWVRQYGSKVWVSEDAGKSWTLRFQIYNWDTIPYSPWPNNKLEYSAIGLDVGWDDSGYTSFVVNQRDSAKAGGTGFYFLHTTGDYGNTWQAPFTKFADSGERTTGKRWQSNGLEVTSVHRLKFHPKSSNVGYAAVADIGGLVTEDGGETWRITKANFNTNSDYAFDPEDKNLVFASSSNMHDFPVSNYSSAERVSGGIYRSIDRGRSWVQLTPANAIWNIGFLSVGYDPFRHILYGGSRGSGVGRSADGGKTWEYFNEGLPPNNKMISQIEIDPANGNVYILLSGDAPFFTNQQYTGIYLLDIAHHAKEWQLLRGKVNTPVNGDSRIQRWWFPTAFAVDFSRPKRDVLWLADMECQGAWLGSGVWKSTNSGATWDRLQQFTHPTAITIDYKNSNNVYLSGLYTLDGSWGEGGAFYTTDGGLTWKKNENIPFLANLDGTVLDPNHENKLFYLFFGNGMLYGDRPQ